MRLDLSSLAFGSVLEQGGGTPSWGTALGQSVPEYKYTVDGAENILVGMLYCSVNLHHVSLPLGKGGAIGCASDLEPCQLAALFRKVFINGISIGYPFIMVYIKEQSKSHNGRRSIKYSDKNTYTDGVERISNMEFFRVARKALGLNYMSCWFIHEAEVKNFDELHFRAVIVNRESTETYRDARERKNHWLSLI